MRLCGMAEEPFCPARERLFDFAHFGALQMADFERDLFERRGEQRERGDPGRMAVARDHLRGDVGRLQAQARADFLFGFGADVAEGSDGARNFADAQIFGGGVQAREIALHLVVPQREFQAEGDGLGVHAVGAADLRRCA